MKKTFQKIQEGLHAFLDELEHFEFEHSDTLVYRGHTEEKPQEFIEITLDNFIQEYIKRNPENGIEYSVYPHRVICHSKKGRIVSTEITRPMTYDITIKFILKDRNAVREFLQNLNADLVRKIDWYGLD